MEWVEITGATVEEARERALDRLGVDISDAEIEVLEEPGRALLGLRRTDARVRARVAPTAPPPRQERNDRRRSQKRRSGGGGSGSSTDARGSGGSDSSEGRTRGAKSSQGRSGSDGGRRGAKSRGGSRRSRSAAPADGSSDRAGTSGDGAAGADTGDAAPRRRRRRTARPNDGEVSASTAERAAGDASTGDRGSAPAATRTRRVAGTSSDTPSDGARRRRRRLDSRPASQPVDSSETEARDDTVGAPSPQEETMSDEVSTEEQGTMIVEFLDGLLEHFGLDGSATVTHADDDAVEVSVDGGDLGLLIGPGGHTLSALTEVTKTVLQRQNNGASRARVRIDVAGYRERRRAALEEFAREVAADVVETGEPRALEPMHSADRKIVHDTVNEIDGVDTVSDGDEPRRRVVIVPAD